MLLAAQGDASVFRTVEFGGYDEANAVTGSPGGTIVVAGRGGSDAVIARLRLDGQLDRSFGEGGRVRIDGGRRGASVAAVAVDQRGRILLAGEVDREGEGKWLVVRLRSDGRLDSTFGGGDGRVTLSGERFDADCAGAGAVASLPGGGVAVGGYAGCGGEGGDGMRAGVVRLRSDGRLDRSFSRNGVWTSGSLCAANDLLVQPGGRIVIGGSSGSSDYCYEGQMRLLGLTRGGRLDRSFGRAGRVDVRASRRGESTVVDLTDAPAGRILAAGSADGGGRSGFAVARFEANGQLDRSFGVLRGPSMGGRNGYVRGVAVGNAGQVVLAGLRTFSRNRYQAVLARYARGRGTRQIIAFGGRSEFANAIANIGGRLVVVGNTTRGRDSDFAIAILR